MVQESISSIEAVQNPALGGVMMWAFGRGYQEEVLGVLPPLHLSFLVLPIALHRPTLDIVSTTYQSSGLGKFVEKFARQREDLMAIHTRALLMRRLSLEALSTGVAAGLLTVIYDDGLIRANDVKIRRPTERIKPYVAGAEKLGRWMARLPPANVFSLLHVRP